MILSKKDFLEKVRDRASGTFFTIINRASFHNYRREVTSQRYLWAYREVNLASFGVPIESKYSVFAADNQGDVRDVLFADDHERTEVFRPRHLGFYPGGRLVREALPALKKSGPPLVYDLDTEQVGQVDTRDVAALLKSKEILWSEIYKAVPKSINNWLLYRMACPGKYTDYLDERVGTFNTLPKSAWGVGNKILSAKVGREVGGAFRKPLMECLEFTLNPVDITERIEWTLQNAKK